MTDFESQVISDLSVLKSQMRQIMGIGQPGRLAQLEARMDGHERTVQKMKGMAGAFGGILTVVHIAIDFFAGKR
jgi:hypothetical protein